MKESIKDLAEIQSLVGKLIGPKDLKVITFLDDYAHRWINESTLILISFGRDTHVSATLGGGTKGFLQAPDPLTLTIPLVNIDSNENIQPLDSFGSLILIPGMNESLRINGQIISIQNNLISIRVQACYLHCAKALIRSDFWNISSISSLPHNPDEFLASSPFMALATLDINNNADMSPKGDPAGSLLTLKDNLVAFPDRPGNRRIDSFSNILTQANVAIIALIPGYEFVLKISGSASVTNDPVMCEKFSVNGIKPKLITNVEVAELHLIHSHATMKSNLWSGIEPVNDLKATDIFKAHVKLNKTTGLAASMARLAVSIPKLMESSLDRDYKNNLY